MPGAFIPAKDAMDESVKRRDVCTMSTRGPSLQASLTARRSPPAAGIDRQGRVENEIAVNLAD